MRVCQFRQGPILSKLLVAEEGLEPSRPRGHWFLRPACLPIPPPRLLSMLHSGPDWILASDCTYDRPEWPAVENVHAFGRGHALPTAANCWCARPDLNWRRSA